MQSMYENLRSCVRTQEGGLKHYFDFSVGTRQGCMLSPFLFALYIGKLVDMLKNNYGIFITEELSHLNILLYADDIALFADSVKRLNTLSEFCKKWGLAVNISKTKIIIFRNGGIVKHIEKWNFHGKELINVTYYKYLSILFSSRLTWHSAQNTLCLQANKALVYIYKLSHARGGIPINIACKLFGCMVLPILSYGSEMWGYEQIASIERVHIKSLKRILKVSITACDEAVLGEVGRYPLSVYCSVKCKCLIG